MQKALLFALTAAVGCASARPVEAPEAAATASTRCWGGQLTKVDDSGYRLSSVPMLLRIERRPGQHRMVRELALGQQATVQRDVLYVSDDGEISFVESDARHGRYEANGQIEGETWSSDALSLELIVPDQSIRLEEWSEDGLLYGRYRYRDADGEYGDERFHALSPLERGECTERMELARGGTLEPDPSLPAFAEQVATSPSRVQLTFDWPQNMDATIRARTVRTGTRTITADSTDATYQLRTTPRQDGLRIETRSRELLAMPSHTLDDEDRWERASVLASMFPSVLIGDDGNVAELAEPDDYLEIVRTAFLERWGGGKETEDEDVLEYVDQNLSPELAKVSAQRYWNPLVAFWAGAEMEVGEYDRVELTRQLFVPGAVKPVVVQVPTEYGVDGWVPCRPGDEERACVKLVSHYEIGENDVRRELSNAGEDGKPIRVMRHEDSTRSVLIADPKTLLPYHYYEVRTLDSVMGNAYDRTEIKRREVMNLTFHY